MRRRSFDLAAAITPEGDIFRQQAHQAGHLPGIHRPQKSGEQLLLGFGRSREARPVVAQMLLRPAEPLPAGHLTLAEKAGNLGIVVLEDLAQQEDRPLHGL